VAINYSTKEETRSIKAEYSPFMCFSFSGIGSQSFILVLSSKTFLFQERVPKMYDEETNKKQSNKRRNKQTSLLFYLQNSLTGTYCFERKI